MPDALFLDAGNTLLRENRPRAEIYCAAARAHGCEVAPEPMAAAMHRVHDRLPREIDGAFRYSRPWFLVFIQEVFSELRFRGDLDRLADDLFLTFDRPDSFRVFAEVRPILKRLKGAGVPLGVISNWGPRLSALLARLGLLADFRVVLASAAIRLEKPDSAIFLRAVAELDIDPARCVHVGDDPLLDADAANRCGLRGVLLDRDGRHPDHPDRITSLMAVLPMFGLPPI